MRIVYTVVEQAGGWVVWRQIDDRARKPMCWGPRSEYSVRSSKEEAVNSIAAAKNRDVEAAARLEIDVSFVVLA